MIIIALLLLSLICFVIVGAIICLKLIGINLVDMVAGLTPPSNLQSDLLRLPISTRRRVLSRVKPIFEENAFLATQLERGGNPISLLKRLIANCRKLEAIAELYLSASVLADWRNARKLFEQMLQEPKKELKTQTAPATDETFLSLLEQPLTNGVLSESYAEACKFQRGGRRPMKCLLFATLFAFAIAAQAQTKIDPRLIA